MRELCCGFEYRVGPNDTYASVAKRFGLGARVLQNPQQRYDDDTGVYDTDTMCTWILPDRAVYIIRKGDTLLRIAAAVRIDIIGAAAANPYLNRRTILPDKWL